MAYTLGEAAKAVGKSKATLSKAVKSGRLSAIKKEDGSFSIEAVELHRVYPPAPLETVNSEQKETPMETGVNTAEIMVLQAKLDAARERISDLEEDRDAWRLQASRLLTSPPQQQVSQGFWKKLFG
jgi:hypothetical protein